MAKDASKIIETTKMTVTSLQETTKESQTIASSMEGQSASVQEILTISAELNDMLSHLTNQISKFNMRK